jgi:hypothetical protein
MKKFNKTIKVEVSVDSIAEQLLSNFHEDFKHREMVAETIIGNALEGGKRIMLSQIYNSLNGYTNGVDFKVGDHVICSHEQYLYDEKGNRNHRAIGECGVLEIDVYREDKVKVGFQSINSKGTEQTDYSWVHHTKCSKLDLSNVPTTFEEEEELA